MKRQTNLIALTIIVLTVSALVFNYQASSASNGKASLEAITNDKTLSNEQPLAATSQSLSNATVPTHVLYHLLFRQIAAYKRKAEALERQGQSGDTLRTYFKKHANLNSQQAEFLDATAANFDRAVTDLDARAKKITGEARAHYPHGRLPQGVTLPIPPIELSSLQQQRTALTLQAREQLRASFGEVEFQRFENFVLQDVGDKIKPIVPPHGLPKNLGVNIPRNSK